MNLEHAYRESLEELGYDLEDIYQLDDQLRGHSFNACAASSQIHQFSENKRVMDQAESLIDSLATLELPAWGYGLRFKFGNMKQFKKNRPINYD